MRRHTMTLSSFFCALTKTRLVAVFCIIFLIFCVEMWQEYSFSHDSTSKIQLTTYFNEERARSGINYPICSQLDVLERELQNEEIHRSSAEKGYEDMLRAGQMNCGNIRVGLGILTRRHNVPWIDCVREIIPAKRRLLGFVRHQCQIQQEGIDRYRQQTTAISLEQRNNSSSSSSSSSSSGSSGGGSSNRIRQRGVIFTGKDEHFRDIYQSIYSLRLLNLTITVEIWVNQRDYDICQILFSVLSFPTIISSVTGLSLSGKVSCMKLPNFVHGFTSKFYALTSTDLTDVLFMDADNIAVSDVNQIFDSVAYQRTGAVIWPDLWGNRCRATKGKPKHPGDSAYSTHVLWVAKFAGLMWENIREKAQEAEAGQLAFDLTRHKGLLDFGRKFIEDEDFLKKPINGDKDIFRFAHLIFGEAFYYVPHIPGYSFSGSMRDCIVHFFGGDEGSTATQTTTSALSATSTTAQPPAVATTLSPPITKTEGKKNQGRSLRPLQQRQRATLAQAGGRIEHAGEPTKITTKTTPATTTTNSNHPANFSPGINSGINSGISSSPSTRVARPMFFHQLKTRDPSAFNLLLRVPVNERTAPSACAPIGIVPPPPPPPPPPPATTTTTTPPPLVSTTDADAGTATTTTATTTATSSTSPAGATSTNPIPPIPPAVDLRDIPPLVVESFPPGTEHLQDFAQRLFQGVDRDWNNAQADSKLWWHRLRVTTTFCGSFKLWFFHCTRY